MANSSICCLKCKKPANIKINVLKYCNSCFVTLFESKIQKNIPKICSNQSVFVYLRDSPISAIVLELLHKNFHSRPIKKFEILSENENLKINFGTECRHEFTNLTQETIEKYCLEKKFDVLLYCQSLNESITNTLHFLCEGQPENAIKSISSPSHSDLSTYNLILDIKDKEIMYYMYLKGINSCPKPRNMDKIDKILTDFLAEIDDKNELAFFNFQNTIKKLSE